MELQNQNPVVQRWEGWSKRTYKDTGIFGFLEDCLKDSEEQFFSGVLAMCLCTQLPDLGKVSSAQIS